MVGRAEDFDERPTHLDHVAEDLHAELGEQCLGEGAGGHPGCGFTGRGAFEDVAGVGQAVLLACPPDRHDPGRTWVSGEAGRAVFRPNRSISFCHLSGSRSHSLFPTSMATGDPRTAMANPADDRDLVLLESHPGPAPVAEPATAQFALHLLDGDRQASGQALDDHDERPSVRLTRRQVPEHPREGVPGGSCRARNSSREAWQPGAHGDDGRPPGAKFDMGMLGIYMTGAAMAFGIWLGDELGLYRAMAGVGSLSSDEVASRSGATPGS